MPAKNAAKYVERSLSSVAAQQGSDELKLLVVYAESEDNTLEMIIDFCESNSINYEIWHQKYDMNRDLADAILQISTKYFAFLCFSDEYIDKSYLNRSVEILRRDETLSYVHSNVYTKTNERLVISFPIRGYITLPPNLHFTLMQFYLVMVFMN